MNLLLAVAIGFAISQLALFVTTISLHRGLSHGALTMHPVLARVKVGAGRG